MRNEDWVEIKKKHRAITCEEAFSLVDDVIDTLIEVGNGTTDEMLHEGADKLFVVRDCYIRNCEKPKGRWILQEKGLIVTAYKCSACGRIVRDDSGYDVSKDYPFCHCGADMRGKQDG